MSFFRYATLATIAIFSLLLFSCIDGREEVWLNADGSGRAHFAYDIPATAAKFQGGIEGIKALLDSELKNFSSATREVTQEGDRLKVEVRLNFASVEEISKIRSSGSRGKVPPSFQHLAGIFKISRNLRTVDFTRTVSPGKALPTAFIPASEFKDRKLTYILHLPVVPTESTADRFENGGLTQVWEQPLTSALRKPMVIHFKAKIPIPQWMIYSAVGLLVVVVGIFFVLIRRRK